MLSEDSRLTYTKLNVYTRILNISWSPFLWRTKSGLASTGRSFLQCILGKKDRNKSVQCVSKSGKKNSLEALRLVTALPFFASNSIMQQQWPVFPIIWHYHSSHPPFGINSRFYKKERNLQT